MAKSFWARLKEKFTISILFYLVLIGIVAITTLFPVVFDFENANWNKIYSNAIISLVLVLLTFTYQMTNRKKKAENDKESDLFKAQKNHVDKIHEIQNQQLSRCHELYVEEQNQNIKMEYVRQVFHSYEIDIALYDCESQLVDKALEMKKINREQYSIIKKIRKNDFEVDYYNLQELTCAVILNKSSNTNKSLQNEIILGEITSKVLLIIITSFLWGTLVSDSFEGGIKPQSWIDLAGRLITTISGIWCGDTCGRLLINDDIRLYNKFYNFNNQFLQNFKTGIWKPKEELINKSIVDELLKMSQDEYIEVDEDDYNQLINHS